jgi:cytochrome P450
MADTMETVYWDPFDPVVDADPHPTWRRLRDEAPVYRNDRYGFYALSRFADVEAAHRDPATFSSSHGTVLEIMSDQPFEGGMMIFMDPPEHTMLRALVSRAFTPRRVTALEERIRALCAELLDPHVGTGGFDYVQDFGAALPAMVIATLLGIPAEDQARAHHLIDTTFHIEEGVGMINDVSLTARIELHEYLTAQLAARVGEPGDDMLSDLVRAEVKTGDGGTRRLTLEESAGFAGLLISAGTETVARLLGWAAVVLDEHPGQRAELVADPVLVPAAVEELLRYEAPSPVQGRWTTRPVELHGVTIPQDSKVLLITGSAGRDERRYADADRFDVHRTDQHVSFGHGIHFCLGAALARLEGRIALEETFRRFPTWRVDRDRAVRLHTSTVRGWSRVPVEVGAG